jgi:hypothetical protein
MQVPDEIPKSVAFVYCERKSGKEVRGTAFFVGCPYSSGTGGQTYAITARHVIDGVKERTIDGKVYLRANTQKGHAEFIETSLGSWVCHDDPQVDVAAIPFSYDFSEFNIIVLPRNMCLTDQVIHDHRVGPGVAAVCGVYQRAQAVSPVRSLSAVHRALA